MDSNFLFITDIDTENQESKRCGKMQNSFIETGINVLKTTFDPNTDNGLLPRDAYYGIECGPIWEFDADMASLSADICSEKIKRFIAPIQERKDRFSALVVGIGNIEAAADSLGPLTAKQVKARKPENGFIPTVSVLIPGIFRQTGIDTAYLVISVAKAVSADVIIAVDGLLTTEVTRLGSYIQIGNCGIKPGSGASKRGSELSYSTAGIPVISIGIPTVLGARLKTQEDKAVHSISVCPKDCNAVCEIGAAVLSDAINKALGNFSYFE